MLEKIHSQFRCCKVWQFPADASTAGFLQKAAPVDLERELRTFKYPAMTVRPDSLCGEHSTKLGSKKGVKRCEAPCNIVGAVSGSSTAPLPLPGGTRCALRQSHTVPARHGDPRQDPWFSSLSALTRIKCVKVSTHRPASHTHTLQRWQCTHDASLSPLLSVVNIVYWHANAGRSSETDALLLLYTAYITLHPPSCRGFVLCHDSVITPLWHWHGSFHFRHSHRY